MTILTDLLPTLYEIRGFLDTTVGARPYSVTAYHEVRTTNIWDSNAPPEITTTPIVEYGNGNPKVTTTSHDDYVRGAPADAELTVGPITPEHTINGITQGTTWATLEPDSGTLYFILNGPGMVNVRFLKAGFVGDKTLGWMLYLKRA